MPELPEVETVARQLAPAVEGRTIKRLQILDPLLEKEPPPRLAGRRIQRVWRLGKEVAFELTSEGKSPLFLAVHLRMTGRLHWRPPGERSPTEHLRARFTLDEGALLFYDTRRFGTFKWSARLESLTPAAIDPMTPRFTAKRLAEQLARSDQNIKVWLLRQDRLVGLGNIYASEILHAAQIHPGRRTSTLTGSEIKALHRCTRRILKRAIEACGTTFSDFQDANGLTGSYGVYLSVYDREGERCKRCPGTIERFVQAQRSTYCCPQCQI